MPTLSAVTLPDHLDQEKLTGSIAVVIDVLRATTTIAQALQHGARCIIPVASIDSARMIAHKRQSALLCGERGGIKPEGFTLGNSPAEYTQQAVGGRDLVLTTTNGTRAMHMCDAAYEVLTGSITNLGALVNELSTRDQHIVLVCSGTDRKVSLEDAIAAGLIAQALQSTHTPDDSATLLRDAALGAIQSHGSLELAIASSFHAARLNDLGFGADVRFASQRSCCPIVPRFDPATGEITGIEQPQKTLG
ncbi:MAG: 2-phosphosulfolactate phosphatase [Phycisphaerae bacterium]|nr:2-phosphosulfolactate phosphatase [Phycisphaerae bacterium]MBM90235.1 2-phosphosulfolactate phosphatase [Phycisphaerae bacterium]HCT44975.1 2-phosphosulfolactate phosphatase [Phycisphaerales bacterium]